MTSLVERYGRHHRKGHDCRVTCTRNLLEFHGHRHSYAVIQGLASSFFFVYRTEDSERARLLFPEGDFAHLFWPVSGQRLEVLENLAYLFNAVLVQDQKQGHEEALARLEPYLAAGLPVLCALSRKALAEYLGGQAWGDWFPAGVGFGGHWVIVVDVDRRRRVVTLFETDRYEPIELPFEVFFELRTLGDDQAGFAMKSLNRWAVFCPPRHVPPFASLVRTALTKVVWNLRCPALDHGEGGIAALDRFCTELPGWGERPDLPPEKLFATVSMMWLNSEFMVGGALGRRSFGMFLRHAGREIGAPSLLAGAEIYADAAEAWSELVGRLHGQVADTPGPWSFRTDRIAELLTRLRQLEHAGLEALETFLAAPAEEPLVTVGGLP